jgi:hypothetical protein
MSLTRRFLTAGVGSVAKANNTTAKFWADGAYRSVETAQSSEGQWPAAGPILARSNGRRRHDHVLSYLREVSPRLCRETHRGLPCCTRLA